jgi:putative hydrolase of the HAD superfamily
LVRRYFPRQARDAASERSLIDAVFQGFGGDWAQFDRGLLDAEELVPRIAQRTGLDADEVRALVDGVPPSLTPKADTVDLLRRLHHADVRLHFLSNMPTAYAGYLDRTHPELMLQFDDGIYSSQVRWIKPEAEIFALAAERFGAPAHRLVLLDDVIANVEAARANGWKALHFNDAASCEHALRAQGWWPVTA